MVLFDRGISKSTSYREFEEKDYKFVTRLTIGRKYKIISKNESKSNVKEDIIINFYDKQHKCIDTNLRVIKLLNKEGNEIWFLTNLFDMPALDVTELYKRRLNIEVFFKFIKQNLGYKHFLSHSLNGMKVYIYMILITALLFLIYKARKKLHGFKIPLFQFTLDLEKSFIKTLIIISGGDFNAVKHLF
ncbi:putative transposase y4zB [Holospora elegans E1]|uniref:Putative transposase y4zB n=1 Tax=Holospora elegans E1 TaxID=1427503 RepID=A0A023DX14_9PROT|nr:putative transposase y4zB [Holospora elegans E1]